MKTAGIILLSFASLFTFFGCNESLPIYTAPSNVLSATVTALGSPSDTVKYRMDDENNPNLIPVLLFTPPVGFEVKVVNIYSETIQDAADVQGTLELTWIDKVEYKASIPLTLAGITGSKYDSSTNLITLNPGDTIALRTYWNYHFTNNEWAFTHLPFIDGLPYHFISDRTAVDRFHEPMLLRAIIKIKMFRSLSFIDAQSKNAIPVSFKGQIISQIGSP